MAEIDLKNGFQDFLNLQMSICRRQCEKSYREGLRKRMGEKREELAKASGSFPLGLKIKTDLKVLEKQFVEISDPQFFNKFLLRIAPYIERQNGIRQNCLLSEEEKTDAERVLLEEFKDEFTDNSVKKNRNRKVSNLRDTFYLPTSVCTYCPDTPLSTDSRSQLYCSNCGVYFGYVDSDKTVPYVDAPRYSRKAKNMLAQYERINHFREFIRRYDLSTNTRYVENIVVRLREEFIKMKIPDSAVTAEMVKKRLRHLGLPRFYELATVLAAHFNMTANPILSLSAEQENMLCLHFILVERMFQRLIDQGEIFDRKNFISYPLVFWKLCEFLEIPDYGDWAASLRSDELLMQQDTWLFMVFQKFGWPYKPIKGMRLERRFPQRKRKKQFVDSSVVRDWVKKDSKLRRYMAVCGDHIEL
jgi:hypothetical protein